MKLRMRLLCGIVAGGLAVLGQSEQASAGAYIKKWTAEAGFELRDDEVYKLVAGLTDMDGDGKTDVIVVRDYEDGDSTVILAYTTGVGGLTPRWHYSVSGGAFFGGFADIDGDSQKEAILDIGDPRSVQLVDWQSGLVEGTVPGYWQGIIDFEHDEYPDLLIDNYEDSTLQVWGWDPDAVVGVSEESGGGSQPQSFRLAQNIPNPFNSATGIAYEVRHASRVKLAIYNSVGQRVRCLVDAERPAGSYREEWDGRDDRGHAVASGVYFYQLSESGQTAAKKMVLLK